MVSLDDREKNAKFAESLSGNFPLLSDPSKEAARAYGVLGMGGLYAKRWTFYIGLDGNLSYVDKDVDPQTAGQDIIDRLTEIGAVQQ